MNKFLFWVGTYLDSPLHAPLCKRPLTCPWKVCLVLVIFFLWEWDINPLLNPQPGGARHCNFIHLAPAVQKVDNTIHSINHYPVDSTIGFPNMYPVDSAIQLLNSWGLAFHPKPAQYSWTHQDVRSHQLYSAVFRVIEAHEPPLHVIKAQHVREVSWWVSSGLLYVCFFAWCLDQTIW